MQGDKRIIKRFLFFPCTIQTSKRTYEWRWLGVNEIEQEWKWSIVVGGRWENIRFIDKNK